MSTTDSAARRAAEIIYYDVAREGFDLTTVSPREEWEREMAETIERETGIGEAHALIREIAEAKGFDNIGNWARNKCQAFLNKQND